MKRYALILLITVIVLSGCGVVARSSESTDYYGEPIVQEAPAPAFGVGGGGAYDGERAVTTDSVGFAPEFDEQKSYDTTVSNLVPQQERMVIQNADLSIVVTDPKVKMDAISAMATRMGGFVVSSNLYQNYTSSGKTVPEASITIRVPAEKLGEALDEIKEGVGDVQYENRSGQDVTQSYTDLRSRLKNLEAAEEQLQEILDKTTDTDAVIDVFNQLVYYREQIELVKGQMQYYEQSAALSAISVRIVAEETIAPIEIGGWKPQGVARDAVQALVNFLQGFVEFLIYLIILIVPVLIVVLLPLWLIWLGIRRVLRKRKATKAPPTE